MESINIDNAFLFEMLCIRAGEDGRDDALFGGSVSGVRKLIRPFITSGMFPDVFFEFPLTGTPFLDVTVLYGELPRDAVVESPYAGDCDEMLDCYRRMRADHPDICFGFELDTSGDAPKTAAVHFEPRAHTGLAVPFCTAAGMKSFGTLYEITAHKLENLFPPSYFGMFRGRDDAPLRVCGYINRAVKDTLISSGDEIVRFFDTIGFTAYDDEMLSGISEVLKMAPLEADYQFDIYPDGSAGDVFSIDIKLAEQSSEAVRRSFESGTSARIMAFLMDRGIADNRCGMIGSMATSIAIPVKRGSGETFWSALIIQPAWIKVRWKCARLQAAKCYSLLQAYPSLDHLSS